MILLTGMKGTKGFLLLEVMVSVAVLSIGLVLVLASFIRSLEAIDLSEDYFKAGLLIEDKLFGVYNAPIEAGLSDGVFSGFGNRFSWNLSREGLQEEGVEDLDKMIFKVLWKQGAKEKDLIMETYLQKNTET